MYSSGAKYIGAFKGGKMHGDGALYFSNGNKYFGQWEEQYREGKGKMIYANGDIKSTTSFLFFKARPKLAPGAMVVVPSKAEKSKVSLTEVLAITTALSTLGLLISSF